MSSSSQEPQTYQVTCTVARVWTPPLPPSFGAGSTLGPCWSLPSRNRFVFSFAPCLAETTPPPQQPLQPLRQPSGLSRQRGPPVFDVEVFWPGGMARGVRSVSVVGKRRDGKSAGHAANARLHGESESGSGSAGRWVGFLTEYLLLYHVRYIIAPIDVRPRLSFRVRGRSAEP